MNYSALAEVPANGTKSFLQMREEKTKKPSPALQAKPPYSHAAQWYLEVFSMLSPSRSVGMSIGAIPFSEIACYVDKMGSIEEDDKDFISIIQAIDNAYLEQARKPKGVS